MPRWLWAGHVTTAAFAIPCVSMMIVAMSAHVGGAAAVGKAGYAAVVMMFAQAAMVAKGARACDVVTTTAAIPPVVTVVIRSSPDVNGAVSKGQCAESGTP